MNIHIICFIIINTFFHGVKGQDNLRRKVSDSLLECYNNSFITIRENHLPYNMHSFIAILRKIEDNPMNSMDLLQLSVALLHRFRQDGIVRTATSQPTPGVIPIGTDPDQVVKGAQILRMVPQNSYFFPNNTIDLIERCTLHFMISSSIDKAERGDESSTCRLQSSQYRHPRRLRRHQQSDRLKSDVEMLTDDELKIIQNSGDNESKDEFIPNTFYPQFPPNHPARAHLNQLPLSKCPIESGILKTNWGTVSGASLLGGIAAALENQEVKISNLVTKSNEQFESLTIDNKWLATLSGDLAELVILQGPDLSNIKIGIKGHWNSTVLPKYYFLEDNNNTQATVSEVRGDLDGLILASNIENWYKEVRSLRLSQIFDMYYSDRGVFDSFIRACNRRALLTSVAPNDTAYAQTYAAAVLLDNFLSYSYITNEVMKTFALKAVNKLFNFIPSSMNDPTCDNTNKQIFNHLQTDLTIFVDTNWQYSEIQPILTILLENLEVHRFSSNFTLLNAFNGEAIINSSNSILDFYNLTEYQYSLRKGRLDVPKIIDVLIARKIQQLNKEWESRIGGGRSDTVLIISSTAISDADKTYCLERLKKMREDIPDVNILFLTSGSKEKFSELAVDPNNDIFIVGTNFGTNTEVIARPIIDLINRMKRIPKRLINSQCGANYAASGSSEPYSNYLQPSGISFYRLYPNYFYKTDYEMMPSVKIQSYPSGTQLTICNSRDPLHINATGSNCTTSDIHTIQFSCTDASYIHQCNPFYLSIATSPNVSSLSLCQEPKLCRYPDMTKYTISYENLICTSTASSIVLSNIFNIITIIYMFTRSY